MDQRGRRITRGSPSRLRVSIEVTGTVRWHDVEIKEEVNVWLCHSGWIAIELSGGFLLWISEDGRHDVSLASTVSESSWLISRL